MTSIPEAVCAAARFPLSEGPDPVPGLPIEKIREPGLTVVVLPGPTGGLVEARVLAPDGVEAALARSRALLRERGKTRSAWWVSEHAQPEGLAATLRELGLRPYDEPPFEPRFAAMACVEPPEPGPADAEARPAATFDEYVAGIRLSDEIFELTEEDRRAWEEHEQTAFELQLSGRSPTRSFVALAGGEVVGAAGALLGERFVNLIGGSVRSDMRGRGIYRSLVRARWDHAVERGTPALTVQAGKMSRPILERLGFEIVGWEQCLLDRFAAP